ncbi:MAG: adenylyltransferase/cytidyltransferase family protein, partial [Nitrospinota bacterium]|nr:adenylyltransferase/cytidyltransferase family protein [Nitrospinota bacterium]
MNDGIGSFGGKLLTADELVEAVERDKKAGKRVIFTNGCFDLIHAGHVRYLREASALGDVLILAVNSDESARRLK